MTTTGMRQLDELPLINVTIVLLIIIILSLSHGPVRIMLGVPFVLFFPGYILTATLYPRRDDLDGVERLALSFALSLAIVPLIGLALSFLPGGIRLTSTLSSLTIFIIACSLSARGIRRRLPRTERFSIEILPLFRPVARFSWFFLTAAAILMVSIVFASWHIGAAGHPPNEAFTDFYMLGSSGAAEHYPNQVIPRTPVTVVLGIANHELEGTNYRIVVRPTAQATTTIGPVVLHNGQTWEHSIKFIASGKSGREKVEFLLFKQGEPTPYRALHLWMDMVPASP